MKAVVIREFGPPGVLRLEDVPGPSAGQAQVVIDVAFASITFVETQVRAGRPPSKAMLPALPAILGNGVGGGIKRLLHGQDAQPLQELGLAAVAPVEGAHADPGALGDGDDGRARAVRGEDVARRVKHGEVIAPRLGLPAAAGERVQRACVSHPLTLPVIGLDHSDKIYSE